ncbi:MAG: hypothetical protein WC506_06110 [Candidatus Micrarchaeia archaeon]
MPDPVYDSLNKGWKSTCKIVFGEDIGELEDFGPWLEKDIHPLRLEKSAVSGREVEISIPDYAPSSRFMSFDEIDFGRKFQPLSINEVKDIDSIVEAVRERIYYTGNLVLGNSSNVGRSNNIVDSHYIWKSNRISDSKYIAYSQDSRYCEYFFGGWVGAINSFCIKSGGGRLQRCFEAFDCESTTSAYYCALVQNSQECMFSFGCRSKNYIIGNLPLPKGKYERIKQEILAEIAQALGRDKRVFSLFDIIERAGKYGKSTLKVPPQKEEKFNKQAIESAFSHTTALVLGRELSGIDDYSKFLLGHVQANRSAKSPLTGKKVIAAGFQAYFMDLYDIGKRTIDQYEIDEIGKTAISMEEATGVGLEMDKLARALYPIAYACFQKNNGTITNVKNGAVVLDSSDCYEGCAYSSSKKCAYCFWPRESENIFGSEITWSCSFCIKCFHSKKLTRCFECDNCESCSDTYYSHNCENSRDSMFCFNAKNLAHSIGNAQLPPEKYKGVKSAVLEQIATELEKKKTLKWDIFTLGAGKAK